MSTGEFQDSGAFGKGSAGGINVVDQQDAAGGNVAAGIRFYLESSLNI